MTKTYILISNFFPLINNGLSIYTDAMVSSLFDILFYPETTLIPLPQLDAVGFNIKNLFILIVLLRIYSNSLYYAGKIQECG